jgi:multiple sugar transport system substrate-binding protein
VTELNVPNSDGDAKLLSSISAGDPPDVFTEWNPVLGEYAQDGALTSLNKFLTGKYAGLEKWLYPVALKGGVYKNNLIALPMSMNSLALYYNKDILSKAHISPPKTLAELDADQAKLWKFSDGRLEQIGYYPLTSASSNAFTQFTTYFGVKGYVNGKYNLASNPRAIAEMNWLASYAHYSYSDVEGLDAAFGTVNGGSEDAFDMGKEAFYLDGPWEGYENIPPDNPSLVGHFGVESFPTVPGGPTKPSTWVNGNYNIIPKGAKDPSAAFTFIAWLAGFDNTATMGQILPTGGWIPTSPSVAAAPAYKAWLAKNPWLKPFITQFSSPYSAQTQLTPAESVYDVALTDATEYLATGKMTAIQALRYIDNQANAALAKAKS